MTRVIVTVVACTAAVAFHATPDATQAGRERATPRGVIITASDDMKYSVTAIEAQAREPIKVTLKTISAFPKVALQHNFVLLKSGSDPAAFSEAAVHSNARDLLPPRSKHEIIAATLPAGRGETVEVTFNAPSKPGSYTYLCTYPGHFASGMHGTLVVKPKRR